MEIDGHGGVNVKGQIKGDSRAQPLPAAYAIMRPEDFGFQAFPFEMEGKTDKIMAEFPRNYGNRVQCLLNISGELRVISLSLQFVFYFANWNGIYFPL